MGLAYAGIPFEIREVKLQNKPAEMVKVSSKATVPVLVMSDGEVLDESLDILLWSLSVSDPDGWMGYPSEKLALMAELVGEADNSFKAHLDHYKYSVRFPEESMETYRIKGEVFLAKLETMLQDTSYLFDQKVSYADIAIFPFIRQFSNVEPAWFQSAPYPNLRSWLVSFLECDLFCSIMKKYSPWKSEDPEILFSPASILRRESGH